MIDINFTYTIILVDQAARCMEIVYAADGHQTMNIGARLPFEGENLEDVVVAFAPLHYWAEQKQAVVAPPVGTSGAINFVAPNLNNPVTNPNTIGTQTI
jgi:hypothetical protein